MEITNKSKTTSLSIQGAKPIKSGKGFKGGPVRKQEAEKAPLLGVSPVHDAYICYSSVSQRSSVD